MKTIALSAAVGLTSLSAFAQLSSTTTDPTVDSATVRVLALDASSSAVEWTESITNAATGQITQRNHSYVQVGSGLNYQDESGQWRPSRDLIELTDDGGAAALRGPHKLHFNPNLNTQGVIALTTVSNRVFSSHPLALYYFNVESGQSALIAQVKDSIGELHPPNQLVYPDCLEGAKADYRVSYTKAGVEADLVLLAQLPPPETFFGTVDSRSVRLEWLTEFLDPPTPQKRTRILKQDTGLVDETLDFADLWFPLGRTYAWDGSTNSDGTTPAQIRLVSPSSDTNQVLTAKRWLQTSDGRTVLVESVDWQDIAPKLASLPQPGRVASASNLRERVTRGRRLRATKVAVRKSSKPMRVAAAPYRAKGFVFDYVTVASSGTDYTFSGGVTYYVNSSTYFSGTLTFGYGSVIKLSNYAYLLTYGSVAGGGATLTSADDDMYGEIISTGNPTYAGSPALWLYYLASGAQLNSMKIRWAQTAVEFDPTYDNTSHTFQNSRLELCQTGLYASSSTTVSISSSTQCAVSTPLSPDDPYVFTGSLSTDCNSDADGDGMLDSWEMTYFGNLNQNGGGDWDADGVSNLQEYLNGTNPTAQPGLQVFTPLKP